MTARHAGIPGDLFRLRSSGWIISLCLHGSIIFLSGLLAAQIGLAPPSSSFHWDVTVVGPQHTASVSTPAEAPMAFPKDIKSNSRSTPLNAARERRSVAPPPALPALPAWTETIDSRAPDSVVTPFHSESPRMSEHTTANPLHEEQTSDSEHVSHPAAAPLETSVPSHSTQPATVPLETEASPAIEPSSPSPITPHTTAAPPQVSSLPPSALPTPAIHKPDYGWLADPLLRRLETLKQYPASARLNHLEGRVIVRIIIEEDGRITSVAIAKSSGHDVLDQAALDTLRQASPIALSRPLERSSVTIQIPLNYRLGQ